VNDYDARAFWEARLSRHFDLRGAGLRKRGKRFNWWMYRARVDTLRLALARHRIEVKDKSVLDVGCGTGFYIAFWASMGPKHIKGVDIAANSIRVLPKRFPQYSFERMDISRSVSRPGEPFDIVTAFDVLYHIVEPCGFDVALTNLRASVCDDGYIMISDVFGAGEMRSFPHCVFRSYSMYAKSLQDLGIAIRGLYPQFIFLNLPLDVRPTWLRLLLTGLWSAMTYATVIEPIGDVLGAGLYHLDRLLLPRLSRGLSTKLMVCQAL